MDRMTYHYGKQRKIIVSNLRLTYKHLSVNTSAVSCSKVQRKKLTENHKLRSMQKFLAGYTLCLFCYA